jgi:hypothetical protein
VVHCDKSWWKFHGAHSEYKHRYEMEWTKKGCFMYKYLPWHVENKFLSHDIFLIWRKIRLQIMTVCQTMFYNFIFSSMIWKWQKLTNKWQ